MARTERQAEFKRNENLENLLGEINRLLAPAQEKVNRSWHAPRYPVLFIVGAPRSGMTLLLQCLAASGGIAYPSNLLSRFYAAPFLGAKIQQLLTDPRYDFRRELGAVDSTIPFESALGKTRGILAPNEFWYFWRRFIPNEEPRWLRPDEEKMIDGRRMASELASLESVFLKPLALKAMILQFNLRALKNFFPGAIFIHVRRHPFFTMQSLLEARLRYYGTPEEWYSAKPKEYEFLKNADPFEQIAGQVYFTVRAIEKGLSKMPGSSSLAVDYRELCRAPGAVHDVIAKRMAEQGCRIGRDYQGPGGFAHTDQVRLEVSQRDRLLEAYRKKSGKSAF